MVDMARRLGVNALATLPLWLAVGAIVLLSRDLSEVASAAIGAAVLVTIMGIVAIAIVLGRSTRAVHEFDVVVQQSLAIIDCMKEINRRVMHIEGQSAPADSAAMQVALAVTEDLVAPIPVNDAVMAEAAIADAASDVDAVAPAVRQPEVVTVPAVPQQPLQRAEPWSITGIVDLDSRQRQSFLIRPVAAGEDALLAALSAVMDRLENSDETVEFMCNLPPQGSSDVLAVLSTFLASNPGCAERCIVGVAQEALRMGGPMTALVLARLARLGVRLSLHQLDDRSVAPQALAASGIVRVAVDAGGLLREIAADPETTTGWMAGLARCDVALVAENVASDRIARMLVMLGVRLGSGEGLNEAAPCSPPFPWLARRVV